MSRSQVDTVLAGRRLGWMQWSPTNWRFDVLGFVPQPNLRNCHFDWAIVHTTICSISTS